MDEKLNAAVNVLSSLLKSPQRDLRLAATEALGRFPQFHHLLVAAATDQDPWVRSAAEKILSTPATLPIVGDVWGAAA